LCCHVLRLFTQFDIIHIPEHYINKRWTKEYREAELIKHKQRTIDEGAGSENSQISMRYAVLMGKVTEVCAFVSKDADFSKEFLVDIQNLQDKYSAREKSHPALGDQTQEQTLKDPLIRKTKSVDKGARLKKQSEKRAKKKSGNKKGDQQKDPA
jgi:hypothetical protein